MGIGSFKHRGLPVASDELDRHPRNTDGSLAFAFTDGDFAEAWSLSCAFMPALAGVPLERSFNGVFGFTPDGYPLIGEHPDLSGFWVAESVWVTHSVGVAQIVADLLTGADPAIDPSPADLSRFDAAELEPSFFEPRCADQYVDVYVAHHPVEPHGSARDIRFSAFAARQRELGAAFVDVATWERPQWYASNAALVDAATIPARDAWSARYWSPITIAEHLAVRERAGLFDMTPLTRIEVAGPGSARFLHRMVAGRIDRPVGTVTYGLMLNEHGAIVSDVTVARLAEDRFVLGGNGPRDVAWLNAHAPEDVTVAAVTDLGACAALWGPRARDILSVLTDDDVSNTAFPYLTARRLRVAGVEVDAVRISYAGELGWELTSAAADGGRLWDALWESGRPHGLIAAGRAALGTLRLEKGYRAWGTDMTRAHGPDESGLSFTIRRTDVDFVGAEGLVTRAASERILRCLLLDDDQVVMGAEPVLAGGEPVGYVTSAGWGASIGRSIAYAWVPRSLTIDDAVTIAYFDRLLPARVADEPLFDPSGARLRS